MEVKTESQSLTIELGSRGASIGICTGVLQPVDDEHLIVVCLTSWQQHKKTRTLR